MSEEIGLVEKNVESVAPYYRRRSARNAGVQIDLLVQLPRCVYVVEVKRKERIRASVEAEVQEKVDRLSLPH